jgi:hypothetical protein
LKKPTNTHGKGEAVCRIKKSWVQRCKPVTTAVLYPERFILVIVRNEQRILSVEKVNIYLYDVGLRPASTRNGTPI